MSHKINRTLPAKLSFLCNLVIDRLSGVNRVMKAEVPDVSLLLVEASTGLFNVTREHLQNIRLFSTRLKTIRKTYFHIILTLMMRINILKT